MKDFVAIQKMPKIWAARKFLVSFSDISGALAKWACKQSPYDCPHGLSEAIGELKEKWRGYTTGIAGFGSDGPFKDVFSEMDSRDVHKWLESVFAQCPTIRSWNSPKVGSHTRVLTARCPVPEPDRDFIDLGALARNIIHDLMLDDAFQKSCDGANMEESEIA